MRHATYTRPSVYPKQEAAIFCPERFGIIEASTKSGKTVGCIIWLTEQALQGQPQWNYWWVAPIRAQAKIAYERLKHAISRRELFDPQETELRLTLANQTRIWFKGADEPDSLYGDDVHAAVIDEASRCKEESWYALSSTLTATMGPVRIIGNVKGRKNWAYRLARQAEAGSPDMHYARLTAQDAIDGGILTSEAVEAARMAGMPEAVFRELYYAEPSDDQGNPFGLDAIRICTVSGLSDGPAVGYGIDLAKSQDWTVVVGLDVAGVVCAFERWQGPWEETVRRIVALPAIATLIDSTGVGDPIVERLQHLAPGRFRGFKFSSQSKQQLMEGLAFAIQQAQIRVPAGPVVLELEAFEYVYSRNGVAYSAPEGMHDDCVIALALAVQQWTHQRVPFDLMGGFDLEPSEEEKAARIQEGADTIKAAVAQQGYWWPGDR